MPPKRSAARSEADRALWRRAMHDVKPLAPRLPPVPTPAAAAAPAVAPAEARPGENPAVAAPPPVARSAPVTPPATLDRFAGIDRANAERLKRGKHPVEARLDLHGMTQDEAHRALVGFIRGARAGGCRCVLVITGRGRAGGGVLKSAVPRWLEEPELRPHLLAIATAQPRDGGAGALYVMLRRMRLG